MQIVTLETPHREMFIVVEGVADIGPQAGPGGPDIDGICRRSPISRRPR